MAITVSDDIVVFGDIVPCPTAENGDILEIAIIPKVVNTDKNCDFVASFLDFMTNVCKVRFQPTAFDDVGHNLL